LKKQNSANSAFFRSSSKRILTPKYNWRKIRVGEKIEELLGNKRSQNNSTSLRKRFVGQESQSLSDFKQKNPQLNVLKQNHARTNHRKNQASLENLGLISQKTDKVLKTEYTRLVN